MQTRAELAFSAATAAPEASAATTTTAEAAVSTATTLYQKSLEDYERGAEVRRRLADPRMEAQSELRLSQVQSGKGCFYSLFRAK
jgi:hypothetical protein